MKKLITILTLLFITCLYAEQKRAITSKKKYSLKSFEKAIKEKDKSAFVIGHNLITNFPNKKFGDEEFWFYQDHYITKKILLFAESLKGDVFILEGRKILAETKNPLCKICVLDAFGKYNLKNKKYIETIKFYSKIIKQFPYYHLRYDISPSYDEDWQITEELFPSLDAYERIAEIYLYKTRKKQKAYKLFEDAGKLTNKLLESRKYSKKTLEKRLIRFKKASKGIELPEISIVEGTGIAGHYGHYDWHPQGKKIIHITYNSEIYEKDLESNSEKFILKPANQVHYTRSGDKIIYVWKGQIWIYNLKTLKQSKVTTSDDWAIEVAVSPKDNILAYRNQKKGTALFLLNFDSKKENKLSDKNIVPCSWTSDGKTIIGLNYDSGSNFVSINIKTKEIKSYSLNDLDGASYPDISPDGNYFVYSPSGRGSIKIVFYKDGQWVNNLQTWHVLGGSYPKWSPDGRYIIFSGAGNKLYLCPIPEL